MGFEASHYFNRARSDEVAEGSNPSSAAIVVASCTSLETTFSLCVKSPLALVPLLLLSKSKPHGRSLPRIHFGTPLCWVLILFCDPASAAAEVESFLRCHDNSQICLPGRFGYFHVFWANIPVFLDISTKSYSHPTKQIGWEHFLYRNSSSYLGTFWCKTALHNARLR